MTEEWRPVVGFEGAYQVSDQGRVRSVWINNGFGRRERTVPLVLRRFVQKGYHTVTLGRVPRRVHRLVLAAFVGPCPDGMQGAHLNGTPGDNRLINLRWVTATENQHHRVLHGTMHYGDDSPSRRHPERLARGDGHGSRLHPERRPRGEGHPMARLTEASVREIRQRFAAGDSDRVALAASYGVTKRHVDAILRRRVWAHLTILAVGAVVVASSVFGGIVHADETGDAPRYQPSSRGPRASYATESVQQWRPAVEGYAWPVETALRVIACESEGDAAAVNPWSGAAGLFQTMPTWRGLAWRLFGSGNLLNPEVNIGVAFALWQDSGERFGWHWAESLGCWS